MEKTCSIARKLMAHCKSLIQNDTSEQTGTKGKGNPFEVTKKG